MDSFNSIFKKSFLKRTTYFLLIKIKNSFNLFTFQSSYILLPVIPLFFQIYNNNSQITFLPFIKTRLETETREH